MSVKTTKRRQPSTPRPGSEAPAPGSEAPAAGSDIIGPGSETTGPATPRAAGDAAAFQIRILPAAVPAGVSYWKAADIRHLSADENRGQHHVYVKVVGERGERVRDPALRAAWTWEGRTPDEAAPPVPLDKADSDRGHGNVALFPRQHLEVWIEGDGAPSERVANLHSDHDIIEKTSDGQDGNSRFHHSFLVTFQRVRAGAPAAGDKPAQPPAQPPTQPPPPASAADAARFLREADAVPDGTVLAPGARFAKVWVMRNTGASTWGPGYQLVCTNGRTLGAPPALAVPHTPPGAEASIRVDFQAPVEPGRVRSDWQLAAPTGRRFGAPIWTEIVVAAPAPAGAVALAPPPAQRINAGAGGEGQRLAAFWNNYGGLILDECSRLAIDPADAVGIILTESAADPFGPDGRMTIRFENHIFYRYWGKANEETFRRHFTFNPQLGHLGHTWRPDASSPAVEFHGNQGKEWQVFEFARTLDETTALKSISMGAAQIMGFNHAAVGYPTPQAMFAAFSADAGAQLRALFRFMEVNGLVGEVRAKRYEGFAKVYNGATQVESYANIMRANAALFARLRDQAGWRGAEPEHEAEEARAPQPASPKPGVPLAEADPELYKAWRMHIENGFKNNETMFRRVLEGFMDPYWSTVWMYRILFGVGVVAFVVATAVALWNRDNLTSALLIGGLGVSAFLGYFISRPLQSLEENLQFITWLGIIYNTYWTSLVQSQDPATYQQEVEKATSDAIKQIKDLMAHHGRRTRGRPQPINDSTEPNP